MEAEYYALIRACAQAIGIQSMMNLSLGFDHRLIDGSGGAKFINAIKKYIESSNLENLY